MTDMLAARGRARIALAIDRGGFILDAEGSGSGATGGGPTAGGGFNFQAAVTAVALCHAASGARLGWLEGLEDDAPTAVAGETGGGGDDLRLTFASGAMAEVQIKRGLRAGASLWAALDALAGAIESSQAQYGLLVVSPTASNSIKHALAADLVRIGHGVEPSASGLGRRWMDRLKSRGLDPVAVCARLRIMSVAAQAVDETDIRAARAQLAAICRTPTDQTQGWDRLYRDAHLMIEQRGRRSRSDVARLLRSCGVALRSDSNAPAGFLQRLCDWTVEVNADFTILGVDHPLSLDEAYIELTPYVPDEDVVIPADLASAVAVYHDWSRRKVARDTPNSAPDALGRFYRRCVVVAGPGTGKSTLMTRLARAYARDGLPVLKVSALPMTRRLSQTGETFLEAAMALGLQDSGITPSMALAAGLNDWVILLDGLDEAGAEQSRLAQGINGLLGAWPDLRVVATTRPVGYRRAPFAAWRHYTLPSLGNDDDPSRILSRLLRHVLPLHDPRREGISTEIERLAERGDLNLSALRTPLMIGLAAAVYAAGGPLAGSRPAFYRAIFELLDREPPIRALPRPASKAVVDRFLDALGWSLIKSPKTLADEALDACARILGEDLDLSSLQARDLADRICAYWESLGLVERLRHGGETALAFVHKTFGEFAAGRYIAGLSRENQQAMLPTILDDEAWAEPLAFAAATGAAEVIIGQLELAGLDEGTVGHERLMASLRMLGDAAPVPSPEFTERLLDVAFKRLTSDRKRLSTEVAGGLLGLGPSQAPQLRDRASLLLRHPQSWSRLAGWAILEKADPSRFSFSEWANASSDLILILREEAAARIDPFGVHNWEDALLGDLILRLVARAIDSLHLDQAQAFLDEVLSDGETWTLSTLLRLERLVKGTPLQADWRKRFLPAASLSDLQAMDHLVPRMRGTFETIMRGIATEGEREIDPYASVQGRPLYLLAALFELVGFRQTSLPDLWPMERFAADADVRWLWRTIVRLSELPSDRVAAEAEEMRQAIAVYEGEALSLIWKQFPKIDAPPLDWSRVTAMPIDRFQLEQVLNRPSSFVVAPALNIALNLDDAVFKESLARRLLASGAGITLWAASTLTGDLPTPVAQALLLQAAAASPRHGFEHLFEALETLDAPQGPHVLEAARASLLSTNPEAAAAAAKYLAKAPHPAYAILIDEAWTHWLKTEKPYPVDGGVVPASPRAQLLRASLALSPRPWRELLPLHSDLRHDVALEVSRALIACLASSPIDRADVARTLGTGGLTLKLTRVILHAEISFGREDVLSMLSLLGSSDDRLRLIALSVLEWPVLTADERRAHLEPLRYDPCIEVRESVARQLEALGRMAG